MPTTALEASSCARMVQSVATIACDPYRPSEPTAVSTGPSSILPQTAAAEVNNGSTAGVQKLTGGPRVERDHSDVNAAIRR